MEPWDCACLKEPFLCLACIWREWALWNATVLSLLGECACSMCAHEPKRLGDLFKREQAELCKGEDNRVCSHRFPFLEVAVLFLYWMATKTHTPRSRRVTRVRLTPEAHLSLVESLEKVHVWSHFINDPQRPVWLAEGSGSVMYHAELSSTCIQHSCRSAHSNSIYCTVGDRFCDVLEKRENTLWSRGEDDHALYESGFLCICVSHLIY